MENYLNINSKFIIVPSNIDNIEIFLLEDYNSETMILSKPEFASNFNANDEIEVFTSIKDGILYFKSIVKFFKNNMLVITFPKEFQILQRRENKRISINEQVQIDGEEGFHISAKLIDLSVGGIKIASQKQLLINSDYKVYLDFDNLNLKFKFIPLRISYENDNYIISGRLNTNCTDDKINLVQYCYKKLFESSSRE